MLHLPTLLALSFVTCSIVTLLLLLTRATLGRAAAGAITWVFGDSMFQAARLATLAERHADLLPLGLAHLRPDLPISIVPGTLLLAAICCHRFALRRAEGATISVRRRLLEIGLVVAAWCVAGLQVDGFEPRMRLLAAVVTLALLPLMLVSARLARRFWGARVIVVLSAVAVLANIARALGITPDPVGTDSSAISAMFMLNIVISLTVTMSFVVLLQEQVRQHILEVSITDPLTGLFNRRGVLQFLERDLDRSRRGDGPLTVALFDLDHFKRVNDLHGHKAGDAVLAAFAECLRSQCRRGDLLGRWGGEEFIVAMPGTDALSAVGVAERIRSALRRRDWPFGVLEVTVSAGVAQTVRAGAESGEQLIDRADQRLYLAKTRRDMVCAGDDPSLAAVAALAA